MKLEIQIKKRAVQSEALGLSCMHKKSLRAQKVKGGRGVLASRQPEKPIFVQNLFVQDKGSHWP